MIAQLEMPSRDFLRRLGVTIAATLVYLLAAKLPLYGVSIERLNDYGLIDTNVAARLSIAALGMIPILTAVTIEQLVRLFGPAAWAAPAGVTPRWVLWLALALAITQAAGVAIGIEQAGGDRTPLVPEPGLTFRLVSVASMLATTALIWWLATQITLRGLGGGFWILLGVAFLLQLSGEVLMLASAAMQGATSVPDTLATLAVAVAIIAATVFLVKLVTGLERSDAVLWPGLLAPAAINLLILPVGIAVTLFDADTTPLLNAVAIQHPLGLLIMVSMTVLMVYAANRRSAMPLSDTRLGLLALVLVAITVAPILLFLAFQGPVILDSAMLIVLTVVALHLQQSRRA